MKTAWYDKSIRFFLYSLAIVIPVIFSPQFYTVFSMPKLLALRLITLAIILLWGFKLFMEEKFFCKNDRLNLLLIIFGVISIFTTIFSVAFYTSLFGASGRFIGIFTVLNFLILPFLVINFLRDKKFITTFIKVSVITASLLALYGILQYFGIFQDGFNWTQDPSERIFSTIGHSNHFGIYLGINILLGIFIIPVLKKKGIKVLLAAALVLQLVALFLTASRGAIFSMALALLITAIITVTHKWKSYKKSVKKGIAALVIIFIGLFLPTAIFWNDLTNFPLIERTTNTLESIQEGNLPDRVSWWLSSLEMIKDRPILGHGLSTFRDVYNQYRRIDYKTLDGNVQDLITPEAAHNEYLNTAATQGIIGLIAFLAIIFYVLYKIGRALKSEVAKHEDKFYLLVGVKGALLVMLIQFFISFGVVITYTLFYLLVGLGIALSPSKGKDLSLKLNHWKKYVVIIVLFFGIALGGYYTFQEGLADYFYKQALTKNAEGNIYDATEYFQKMVNTKPNEYAYFQAFADFALKASSQGIAQDDTRIRLLRIAKNNYANAIGVNPMHPSSYYNMGVTEFQLFQATKEDHYYKSGESNLQKSMDLAVNNPIYPYQVAKAYLTIGTRRADQKAAMALERSLNIRDPFRDTDIILDRLRPQTAL